MDEMTCDRCLSAKMRIVGDWYLCPGCGNKTPIPEGMEEDETKWLFGKEYTEDWLEKIRRLQKEGKSEEELSLLQKCYKADPYCVEVLCLLGGLYAVKRAFAKSLDMYYKAIDADPFEGCAYTGAGLVFILKKEYKTAETYYEKGLPLMDKNTKGYWIAYANYAIVVAKRGNRNKAYEMLDEAVEHGYTGAEATKMMIAAEKKPSLSLIVKWLALIAAILTLLVRMAR